MVGPGTGIAPFRSFWQQRSIELDMTSDKSSLGQMVMYFGCRTSSQDNIYGKELQEMKEAGVLTDYHVALSREPDTPKVYVQDILYSNAAAVSEAIVKKGGHFYVCGDVSMAHDVTRTLEVLLREKAGSPSEGCHSFVDELRDSNRFHEDIFGVNVRRPGDLAERPKDQSMRALQYLNATSKPDKPEALKEKAIPISPSSPESMV